VSSKPAIPTVPASAECYTVTEAARLEAKIRALPLGSTSRRILERNMITLSVTVEIDDDGRIVLPGKVRNKIGLSAEDMAKGAEAVFAGTLDTFQIWSPAVYDADLADKADAELAALPEDMDILSLLGDATGG
jgi:MraZ protein